MNGLVLRNHSGSSKENEFLSGKSRNRETSWEVLLLIWMKILIVKISKFWGSETGKEDTFEE